MKPKSNRAGTSGQKGINSCQTPAYALTPLLPFLKHDWTIWEPAAGEGLLVRALANAGFGNIYASDILTGQNFFQHDCPIPWDCLVTNPPYSPFSLKFDWIGRCFALGKPFALLVPLETMGSGTLHRLFEDWKVEYILLNKRVNFKMPNRGFKGQAQFPVMWLTCGLNIGRQITYAKIYPTKPILDGCYQMALDEMFVQHAPDVALAQPQQMELVTA